MSDQPRIHYAREPVPEAAGFYERVGMVRVPGAFWYWREH